MVGVFAVSISDMRTNGTLDERVEELKSQVSTEATVVSSIANTVLDVPAGGEEPETTIETVSRLAIANEQLQEALRTSFEMQKAASQPQRELPYCRSQMAQPAHLGRWLRGIKVPHVEL